MAETAQIPSTQSLQQKLRSSGKGEKVMAGIRPSAEWQSGGFSSPVHEHLRALEQETRRGYNFGGALGVPPAITCFISVRDANLQQV